MIEFPTSFSQQSGQKASSAGENCGPERSAPSWFPAALDQVHVAHSMSVPLDCPLLPTCAPKSLSAFLPSKQIKDPCMIQSLVRLVSSVPHPQALGVLVLYPNRVLKKMGSFKHTWVSCFTFQGSMIMW